MLANILMTNDNNHLQKAQKTEFTSSGWTTIILLSYLPYVLQASELTQKWGDIVPFNSRLFNWWYSVLIIRGRLANCFYKVL